MQLILHPLQFTKSSDTSGQRVGGLAVDLKLSEQKTTQKSQSKFSEWWNFHVDPIPIPDPFIDAQLKFWAIEGE